MTSISLILPWQQRTIRHSLVVGFMLFLLANLCVAQQSAVVVDDRPFEFKVDPGTDKNLFSIYVLREIYRKLPASNATAQQQAEWIASTRTNVERMRAVIRDEQLDASLDVMYKDCLNFTFAYETFLSQKARIESDTQARTFLDLIMSALKAMKDGSDAKDAATKWGASANTSDDLGGIAAIVSGLEDSISRSNVRDAQAKSALQIESQKLNEAWSTARADASLISDRLARSNRWGLNEPGFDGFSGKTLADYVDRMPRNPFALIDAATYLNGKESAEELKQHSKECLYAASLVPDGRNYDDYRDLFLYIAADLAVRSASIEIGENGYSAAPAPTSGYAVHMVRTYLTVNPSDQDGTGNLLLARALGMAGRYADAADADRTAFRIAAVNQNDGTTAFRYASLLSLMGNTNDSERWIERAYSLGYDQIDYVRRDPDLRNLWRARPGDFGRLTTASMAMPQFVWGLILDDATVRNTSPFDLTNVVVTVVVRKGNNTYPFTMKCDRVRTGGVCRVNNVVSIPGDSYDNIQASFSSDQSSR